MTALDRGTTYLVRSEEDRTVLLALWPKLDDRRVEWFDTVHDRAFAVVEARSDGADGSVVVRTARATYRFAPLTLDAYRADVRAKVDGQPDFSSTDALQAYYRDFAAG